MSNFGIGTLLCFALVLLRFTSATELKSDFNDVNLEPVYLSEDALKVNINKLVDVNVNIIQAILKKVDPIQLRRIPLLSRGSLSNGRLNNLSQFYRSNDCTLQYAKKILKIDVNVGWNDINVYYDYDFKLWFIQRYGAVSGGVNSLKINLALGIDLENYRVVLESLKFTDVGKFSLKIEGTVGDKIRTFFLKLIMNLAKRQIVSSIETASVNSLKVLIDEVNKVIPNHKRKFRFSYPASARQLSVDAFRYIEYENSAVEGLTIF